jgi:hypothetical protein
LLAAAALAALLVLPAAAASAPIATESMGKAGDHARDCVAEASLDRERPALVDYVVWCAVQSGKVRFSVGRAEDAEVGGFSRSLSPSGPGASGLFHCARSGQRVRCDGRKSGPVTLRGWLAVPAQTRCSVAIQISTPGILYMAKPAGCPHSRPEPAPRDFRYMREFRRNFGLDPDLEGQPAAIDRRIHNLVRAWRRGNPVARVTNVELGLPLRAVDDRELEYRQAYIEQTARVLERWVPGHAASTYAGYDVDHEHGGIFYIGFTGDQDAQLAAFKRQFDLIAPERIRPFPTPPTHSERELRALEREVVKWWMANEGAISSLSIATLANKVEVGTERVAETRRLLAERFGADAPILVVFARPPVAL